MLKQLSLLFALLVLISCSPKGSSVMRSSSATNSKKGDELPEEARLKMTSLYIDAQKAKMLGNLTDADLLLQKCLSIDPSNHAVHYDRAIIAYTQGANGEAKRYAETAAEVAPENIWYRILLAELYIGEGDFDKAEEAYEHVLKTNPDAVEYYYDLSMVRYRKGDIKGAIDALNQIEEYSGPSEEIFQQKQLLYRESGQLDKAKEELDKAIAENPTDPLYYGMMAELYSAQGNEEKALEYYEKILEFDPDNGMVHLSLYEHYFNTGQRDKAQEALILGFEDGLIDIDSKMGILLEFYDRSEQDPAMRQEALDLCKKLIEVYPEDAKSHSIYGDFLLREERYEDARTSFRNAVAIEPDRHIIWSQILILDSQLEDYEGMVSDGEEAVELFPTQPSFYLFTGMAHNRLGRSEEAIEMLEGGKEMVVDDDGILFEFYSTLGDAYNDVKRYADSDKALDKALTISPDNAFLLNNYSYYLSLRKSKLEKAERMALKANELQPGSASFEDTYAWVLYQAGKYAEAKIWMEKALAHGGGSSGVVVEHYGDVLFQLGETELALKEWKKAIALGDHSELLPEKIAQEQIIE